MHTFFGWTSFITFFSSFSMVFRFCVRASLSFLILLCSFFKLFKSSDCFCHADLSFSKFFRSLVSSSLSFFRSLASFCNLITSDEGPIKMKNILLQCHAIKKNLVLQDISFTCSRGSRIFAGLGLFVLRFQIWNFGTQVGFFLLKILYFVTKVIFGSL